MVCTCFYASVRTSHQVFGILFVVCRNVPILFVFCVLLGVPKNAQFRRIMWRSFYFCDFCCTHTLVPSYMIQLISTGRYPLAAVLHVSVHAYAYMSRCISMVPLLWHDAAILVLSFFLCTWECFCARFVHINTLLATFTSLLFMCCVCVWGHQTVITVLGSTLSVANSASHWTY